MRPFKLAATSETRNTCTYCSVACGVLIYSLGDRAKNAKSNIIHIEGDPDHPVNRGTLCPKGSALLDIVHAPTRLKSPQYRAPGSNQFKQVSWDFALDTLARNVKASRDRTFVTTDGNGNVVNRTEGIAFAGGAAFSSEEGYLAAKLMRGLGLVYLEQQARV